ncbi:MAG: hypothetical protein J2P41_16165 [Blastocatellia bacterium]|nr:hypothetical protein [Blastocatellia bacterium]
MSTCKSIATGLRVRLTKSSKEAAAKAASRFYDNEAVSLPELGAPLVARALKATKEHCRAYVLCVHDASPLHYTNHPSKTDRRVMYSRDDLGYELESAIFVSDQDGAPLGVGCMNLAAADGVYSTRRETLLPNRPWIDELNRTMGYIEAQKFDLPVVHVIDREADKVLHLRRFARCNRLFVIRANDVRRLEHEGQSRLLSEVEATLIDQFKFTRKIEYKGKKAYQYVAETKVVLKEPARYYRKRNGELKQRKIPGRPLELRLVVTQVRDKKGRVLATWRLWTNLPPEVDAATIALWYYWRWRIESFFKLLKRAGQHVEQWQQENASRIAKRLLIAAQACVVIWSLMRAQDPESVSLRRFLMTLSGRMTKPGVEYTAPALFDGMLKLLAIADALDRYSVPEIRQMVGIVSQILGVPDKA